MKTYKLLSIILLSSVFIASVFFFPIPVSHAQTDVEWSEPVNLSNSGASTDPLIVVDSDGMIHVIWVDAFDGYKYTKSEDGINWVTPQIVDYPFSTKQEYQPILLAGQNRNIYIFWLDENNALYYGQTKSENLDAPSSWSGIGKLADSVIAVDVKSRYQDRVHIAYVSSSIEEPGSAGVYYQRLTGTNWSISQKIYSSLYFRSLTSTDANVRISVTDEGNQENVYIAWDDRPQKRIYLARSVDGGLTWDEPVQIRGPEDSTGIEFPFNVDLAADENNILLLWQVGLPGGQCTQYSQWSMDGGNSFGEPRRMLGDFSACPQTTEIVFQNQDFFVISLITQNDFSLMAWNGFEWSNIRPQNDLSVFLNALTLDSIFFGCQKPVYYKENLYIVGCDEGNGGDIWFRSRSLGSFDTWFPPPTAWNSPVIITSVDKKLSEFIFAADNKDRTHAFWVQSLLLEGDVDRSTIQYSQWDGMNWSAPLTISARESRKPAQLTAKVDEMGRLLLAWVDEQTGDLLFQWANSDSAGRVSEWTDPIIVPTGLQSNSSPEILTDASGRIVIGYTIPINEQRGVYLIDSMDAGATWSRPLHVFDAVSAGWDMVDQPRLCLTGDGRLNALFGRYSYKGDRSQSMGLYYSQSVNGGVTWSEPELVSEQSLFWSVIYCDGLQTLHRIWQEERQSKIYTLHQISQDSGVTWGNAMIVSNVSASRLIGSTIDRIGNPHVFQLASDNDMVLVNHQKWDGSQWIIQESGEIHIGKFGIPTLLAAAITSNGNLLVSSVIDYSFSAADLKNEIISVGRFLGLPDDTRTPNSVFIATAEPQGIQIEETSESFLTPTPPAHLSNLTNPTRNLSRNRNITGILLIGGALVLIIIVLLPRSKRK